MSEVLLTRVATQSIRERLSLNKGWHFCRQSLAAEEDPLRYEALLPWMLPTGNHLADTQATAPQANPPHMPEHLLGDFGDDVWQALDLPHDWGVAGGFHADLPGKTGRMRWWGIGWYRKTLYIPAEDEGRRIYIDFDGAMSCSTLWVNGRLAGGWACGYTSFRVNITPFVLTGTDNALVVRLDNAPLSSRWYPGGGIYRNVWLVKTGQVHVEQFGVRMTTPHIDRNAATVCADVTVRNHRQTQTTAVVRTSISRLDKNSEHMDGALIKLNEERIIIEACNSTICRQQGILPNPQLWHTHTPNLYLAVTEVFDTEGLRLDRVETTFGVRTIEFSATDGFHLNSERVQLNGVCLHHDLGALGAAFHPRALERQLSIMMEMGVNAIRCSHNPPAPELLDFCDRFGLLVIDEFTDAWLRPKIPNDYSRFFADWYVLDLRTLIRRDRNHPCIILWSTGNEIAEQEDEEGHKIAHMLTDLVRLEDPTRPVTVGCDRPDAGWNGFEKCMDVFGYNYKPHLYAKFREHNPKQALYGSETASCISSRGVYVFPVSDDQAHGRENFHVSSYDLYAPVWSQMPDVEFAGQDNNPSVAGEFVWTGFDYLGEPTPFNDDPTILFNFHDAEQRRKAEIELEQTRQMQVPSRSSYFGIVDLAGFRKDRFYLYQARWRPDLIFAHILPHWTWPGREGQITPVHVYSAADEAELFINGKSLGRKKRGAHEYRFRWDHAIYQPGELEVVAYKNGIEITRAMQRTAGAPARLRLTIDKAGTENGSHYEDDLVYIILDVLDADGVLVPQASNLIEFGVTGAAALLATDNGDPTDHTAFYSHTRNTFHGRALAIVKRAGTEANVATVYAQSEGIGGAVIELSLET